MTETVDRPGRKLRETPVREQRKSCRFGPAGRGRVPRFSLLLLAAVLAVGGCYAKTYEDPGIDVAETALIRGPLGTGYAMHMTIDGADKPERTARVPAGTRELGVQWIGKVRAPKSFPAGSIVHVPFACSVTHDVQAGKKYDLSVRGDEVSLYEYDTTRWTGRRRDGKVVATCRGEYVPADRE